MTRDPLCKVYGHVHPVTDALYAALEEAVASALADDPDEALLLREGDMARISFEGVYFPEDEVLAALRQHLAPDMQGKLDYLDIENWRMNRHRFVQGEVQSSSAPLNSVLDYSGH